MEQRAGIHRTAKRDGLTRYVRGRQCPFTLCKEYGQANAIPQCFATRRTLELLMWQVCLPGYKTYSATGITVAIGTMDPRPPETTQNGINEK